MAEQGYWARLQAGRASRRRFLKGVAFGGASLAAVGLIGCGGSESDGSESSEMDGPLAAKQELTVRYYDDPGGFDPATLFRIEVENIAFNVYSGLTTYEPDAAKIMPDLAESWETPDLLTYNFNLRKGVKWHKDFGSFSSDDVVYSYKRIMDPATASSYRAEFNNVDSITAPDANTVQIKLKAPDANFLHQVANYHQGQVVNRTAIERYGTDYKFKPIGTGPFVFESFTPAQQILLTRFDQYYAGPATLSKIDFRIIKDDNTAAIALQNGEVDLAMRISQNEPLERVKNAGSFTMTSRFRYAASLTIFNLENQYLKDARVRYAYAHAIDYETVQKTINPLTGATWYNLLPEFMDVLSTDVPRYAYDQAKAKSFMQAAGLPNGFVLKQPTTAVNESTQLQQAYLDKIGVKSEFQIVDTPTYNGIRNRGEFDVSGRLLPAVNPDTILFSYLHPDNIAPKGLNGARYNNPQLTSLLESARAEPNFERRKSLYGQVQKIALTDLPYLPTTSSGVFWPGYKWVSGVKINPLAEVGFYAVKIIEHS